MVARGAVFLRRLAGGIRSAEVRFGRFLSNPKVTIERLIEGWADATASAVADRHVLAIQDTTELNFRTTPGRPRGLGEIGKGVGRGLLVHAMLALDASSHACLGLIGGSIWTRAGRIEVPHQKRPLANKESRRWVDTAETAKTVLSRATMVTTIGDQESDIYAYWAMPREPGVHRLGRAYSDRALAEGGRLHTASACWSVADTARIELRDRPTRPARQAKLSLRFGPVTILRPKNTPDRDLPESVPLTLIEVVEDRPPAGTEPVHWRLLTTHAVPDVMTAWQIVRWYQARWTIEQLWRILKKQGLRLEDSQIESAERLLKLAAIAVRAAAVTLQLVQARDGQSAEPASAAFQGSDIDTLDALNASFEAKTKTLKNPHPRHSMAWAAWIIARLGGWDGYPSSRPPGPITYKNGLDYFHAIASGWLLRNVCMP